MAKGLNVMAAVLGGFVAGILLAPKSGKETREDIKAKAEETKLKAGEKADHVKSSVKDSYEHVRAGAKEVGGEVKGFGRSAKSSADELVDEARERGTRANAKVEATKRAKRTDRDDVL